MVAALLPPLVSILAAALSVLFASPGAVVCVGEESVGTGTLQRDLERRLAATSGFELVLGDELGRRLAASDPVARGPAVDLAYRKTTDSLLQEIGRLHYAGQGDDALARLGELALLQEGARWAPATDRTTLLLWRIAVLLEVGTDGAATLAAREALSLDPTLRASDLTYPPSVGQLLDRERAAMTSRHALRLSGLPPGAVIKVNDRPFANGSRVPPGVHRVVVTAPGHRWVTAPVNVVEGDLSLEVSLAPGVAPDVERMLLDSARDGRVAAATKEAIRTLARVVRVDRLAAVVRLRDGRTAVITWDGKRLTLTPARVLDASALAERVATDLTGETRAIRLARAGGWRAAVAAGAGVAVDERTVRSRGAGYAYGFTSATGALDVELARGPFAGRLELSRSDASSSTVETRLADGSRHSVHGGESLGARAGVFWVTDIEGQAPAFELGGSVLFERHRMEDLRDPAGTMGVFPSRTRIVPLASGGGSLPLSVYGRTVVVGARGWVGPWSSWQETPRASGSSPRADAVIGGSAAAGTLAGRWRLTAEYRFEQRGARFSGVARVPTTEPMSDVRVNERTQGLVLTLGRSL